MADGEMVISVYLVSSEVHVREAALSAARFYPTTRRLEVQGVRSALPGAVVKPIVVFIAQPIPASLETPFTPQPSTQLSEAL